MLNSAMIAPTRSQASPSGRRPLDTSPHPETLSQSYRPGLKSTTQSPGLLQVFGDRQRGTYIPIGRSRNRSGSGGGGGGGSGGVGRALFSRLARGRKRYQGRAGRSGGGYLPLRPRRPRLARYLYYSAIMGSQSRGMAKIRNRQIKRNKGGERGARGRYDDRFISARIAEVGPTAARTPSLRGPAGNRRLPQARAAHPEQWRSSRTATDRRRPQWVVW